MAFLYDIMYYILVKKVVIIMGMSFSHLIVVLLIILVLFGAGKLPQVMADLGKGMKAFKDGMNSNEDNKDKK